MQELELFIDTKPILLGKNIFNNKDLLNQKQNQVNCIKLMQKKTRTHVDQKLLNYIELAQKNAPRLVNMSKSQYINYLAIQLLEETGNNSPTQQAINYVESFLKRHKMIL